MGIMAHLGGVVILASHPSTVVVVGSHLSAIVMFMVLRAIRKTHWHRHVHVNTIANLSDGPGVLLTHRDSCWGPAS
jgi:hypothetical protein